MRDIKFRGKSTDSYEGISDVHVGDWVYGNLIVAGRQAYIVNGVIESNDEYISLEDWCPVDIETVGQYTGLKDKNGVEIYEGDIVDFWSRRDYDIEAPFYINRRKRRVVQWISNSYKNTINIRTPKDENLAYHEVIGNIYENPELLKD